MPFVFPPKPTNVLRAVQVIGSIAVNNALAMKDFVQTQTAIQKNKIAAMQLSQLAAEAKDKAEAGQRTDLLVRPTPMPSGKGNKGTNLVVPYLYAQPGEWPFPGEPAGQFFFQNTPEKVTVNHGAQRYPEGSGYATISPFTQWTGTDIDSLTFDAEFYYEAAMALAEGALFRDPTALAKHIERLVKCAQPVASLGRPPIWRFSWGEFEFGPATLSLGQQTLSVQKTVPMQGRTGRVSKLANRGEVSRTTIAITLKAYRPFDYELTNPDASPHSTIYDTALHGEQWEHVARRVYGNAIYGQSLRVRFPAVPLPIPGQIYALPDLDKIQTEAPEPQSIALSWDVDSVNELEAMNARYSTPRYVPSMRAA